jgi:hypothetical protein
VTRKRVLGLVRVAYLVALGLVALRAVVQRRTEIAELIQGTRPAMLAASLVLSFAMLAITSLFWRVALGLLGSPTRYEDVLVATGRSVLARYIPGSVWYAVGRAALLQRDGVPAARLATTAVLEVLMSLATVLALGASLLAVAGEMPGGSGWVVPTVLAFIALTSPPIMRAIIRRLPGHQPDQLIMGWSGYGSLLGIMMVFWLWSAGVFMLYVRAFPANDEFGMTIVGGGFLLAWGIGFLAFVAPQGVGIFEVTLASILVSQGVAEVAVVIAGYRVVILVRDVVATGVSEALASRRRRTPAGAG